MTAAAPTRPPISATVSTVRGWPTIRDEIVTVADSAHRAGGELVVMDGSGNPPPPDGELAGTVRWTSVPKGPSVLQLRGGALKLVEGEVVAVTEDHVAVPPEWATLHVEAHRKHPEALAIGGAVENGSTDHLIDWAGYLAVQCAMTAPIRTGPTRRLSGAVNVSYKRAALEGLDDYDGLGVMDSWHQKRLAAAAAPLWNEDRIRVHHIQALGFKGMTAIHYHSGRAFAGIRRRRFGPVDVAWLLGAPVLPFVRWARVAWYVLPRGYGGIFLRSTPAIVFLFVAQAVGTVTGYLLGPGNSPSQLQ